MSSSDFEFISIIKETVLDGNRPEMSKKCDEISRRFEPKKLGEIFDAEPMKWKIFGKSRKFDWWN